MADEKIIFSMAGVNKIYPPSKQVLKNIYLSFFYGAKIGVLGLNGSGKSPCCESSPESTRSSKAK
jgi:energy-dependent translational throttle protein EttA